MNLTFKPGPHNGVWIMDGDRVVAWCWDQTRAEKTMKELLDTK